jgi:hypothetical protein
VAAFAGGGLLSAIGVGLYVAGALTRNDFAAGAGAVLALGSPIGLGGVFLLRDMEQDVEFPS